MTALAVDRQRRWNTVPRGWRCFVLGLRWLSFQLTDLVEFDRLKLRIRNRPRIARYCSRRLELVFGMGALPYSNNEISSFTSDPASHLQGIAQVGMAALIERAG